MGTYQASYTDALRLLFWFYNKRNDEMRDFEYLLGFLLRL